MAKGCSEANSKAVRLSFGGKNKKTGDGFGNDSFARRGRRQPTRSFNDAWNAWNLNFDSSDMNVNNNNRYNGCAVRAVQNLPMIMAYRNDDMAYRLTRDALLLDLHAAYQLARMHKAGKGYVRTFEKDLDGNLSRLADDILSRSYAPEPSSCFVITRPKKREVFAAQFRDRIVHHLYYNYVHELFERTFIQDSYSCIRKRGTHYGISRLRKHILSESRNYAENCWAMKIDIRGYFMHIDRQRLLDIALDILRRMGTHKADGVRTWSDVTDMDFVEWLTREIVLLNPAANCKMIGSTEEWSGLDHEKSLFNMPEGCGLPIGNLTSQLMSNVYMNEFDQFMKRTLKCRHYGRYVDDAFVVSRDRRWLRSLVPSVRMFLKERLGLELHEGKTQIADVRRGVEFLGAFIKPYRTYMSHASLGRVMESVRTMDIADKDRVWRSVNSFLGIMGHYDSFNVRSGIFLTPRLLQVAAFDRDMSKMYKPK